MIVTKHLYKYSVNSQSKRDRAVDKKVVLIFGIPIFKSYYAEDSNMIDKIQIK